jgi:branched-chain amino acid transport system ATP-binding protein
MGLLPSRGVLRFEGEDLHGLDVEARVERGMCLVPEKRELFGDLSVLDNLQLGAYATGLRGDALRRRLQTVYDRFPQLAERRSQRASTLSGGERQMLAVGRALMSSPRLLMLDEPSLGLAPTIIEKVFQAMNQEHQSGTTVLLVEQLAYAALVASQRGYVLDRGRVSAQGDSKTLLNDEKIREAYLGGGKHGMA